MGKSSWIMLLITLVLAWTNTARATCPQAQDEAAVITSDYLRVVTLNVAHGRADGRNQMLQKTETIRGNLVEVGQVLDLVDAHVVGLQEADAESAWSGNFDHVEFLSEQTRYPCTFHGVHAENRMYAFGTALLSRYPLQGGFSYSFKPSQPTTTKGFVAGAIYWNPDGTLQSPLTVKLISVHLDFSRSSVRRSQIEEMIDALARLEGPMIVMGDFNSDWQNEDSSVRHLAESLGLKAFQPQADGQGTYKDKETRLDWILVSPDFRFRKYAVIGDLISDHFAVAAEMVLED